MADAVTVPDVSIIVIAWNVRDELAACFESIRDHAGDVSTEVLFVDNGSTDGSAELVAAEFPEVQIIRRPTNEGIPARNHGLRRARGRHRMFLDSDARLTAGALRRLVDVLDANPEIGLVGPRLIYPNGDLQLSTRRFPPLLLPLLRRPPLGKFFDDSAIIRRHLMSDDSHEHTRKVEYVLGACQLFRAEAQWEAGEIDQRIWYGADDADWCFAIRLAGMDVVYVPDAEVIHDYRRKTAAQPLSRQALRHLRAHFYLQRKWLPNRRRLRAEGRAMDAGAVSC